MLTTSYLELHFYYVFLLILLFDCLTVYLFFRTIKKSVWLSFKVQAVSLFWKKYSWLIYPNFYGGTYKSSAGISALLCLTKKRFWVILIFLITAIICIPDEKQSTITSLFLSFNAAGIFYIFFNLYPEIEMKCLAARQALSYILQIKRRRALFMNRLVGTDVFTESNRFLSESSYMGLINKLRILNGYNEIPHGDGVKISYRIPPLDIPWPNGPSLTRVPSDEPKTWLDACKVTANMNLAAIQNIKNIPNIERLAVYNSVIYLEKEMNEFIHSLDDGCLSESRLVAYFLSAPDKVNYNAQKEFPKYVGNRFKLKFNPTKEEENGAKNLVTIFHCAHKIRHK